MPKTVQPGNLGAVGECVMEDLSVQPVIWTVKLPELRFLWESECSPCPRGLGESWHSRELQSGFQLWILHLPSHGMPASVEDGRPWIHGPKRENGAELSWSFQPLKSGNSTKSFC